MKQVYRYHVRGLRECWWLLVVASEEEKQDLLEDGIALNKPLYSIPDVIVTLGLTGAWIRLTDLWRSS